MVSRGPIPSGISVKTRPGASIIPPVRGRFPGKQAPPPFQPIGSHDEEIILCAYGHLVRLGGVRLQSAYAYFDGSEQSTINFQAFQLAAATGDVVCK